MNCQLILVGLGRVELPTPALSAQCSNQLSYRPTGIGSRFTVDGSQLKSFAYDFHELLP
jgi:hypothetical protein